MKKILVSCLTLLMIFGLVACGQAKVTAEQAEELQGMYDEVIADWDILDAAIITFAAAGGEVNEEEFTELTELKTTLDAVNGKFAEVNASEYDATKANLETLHTGIAALQLEVGEAMQELGGEDGDQDGDEDGDTPALTDVTEALSGDFEALDTAGELSAYYSFDGEGVVVSFTQEDQSDAAEATYAVSEDEDGVRYLSVVDPESEAEVVYTLSELPDGEVGFTASQEETQTVFYFYAVEAE